MLADFFSDSADRHSSRSLRALLLLALVWGLVSLPAVAQVPNLLGDAAQGSANSDKSNNQLQIETSLTAERMEAGAVAVLSVKVKIPRGFALYSMDPSFSQPTKIELAETPGLQPLGRFTPDHAPKRSMDPIFNQELEKFTGEVTWAQPMRILDPSAAQVSGTLTGVYCSTGEGGSCIRSSKKFVTELTQGSASATAITPADGTAQLQFDRVETPQVNGEPGPAIVRMTLSPEQANVGDNVTLSVTMTLDKGWHTYSITQPSVPGAQATRLQLAKSKGLTPIGEQFLANPAPTPRTLDGPEGASQLEEHDQTVTWTREFRVDDPAFGIAGSLTYVTCRESLCLQPKTIAFELGDLAGAGDLPAALPGDSAFAATGAFKMAPADAANLPLYLALAFLGGFVLNFMPCVLPVVAIKVMGFVQHAGQRRGKIFALNSAYALGVISVFLLLATLAALPQFFASFSELLANSFLKIDLWQTFGLDTTTAKWGGLFQSPAFTAGMAIVVFIMGLSLLGVYEIPIPGMVGSAAGTTRQEGLAGAFLMGVFTTLLATPCTGPFLTTTLGWSLQQPIAVTFSIWGTMGLGMASPYLIFGLIPSAVAFLPRPGNWMIYLKQFAGFVLMGTVLWLMNSLRTTHLIPLLLALLGIAIGCWIFGLVQYSTIPNNRRLGTVAGVALGVAAMYFSFGMTQESTTTLAWQPFSTERVHELIAERKTVLVDFTADWCANCKVNEKFALNTKKTKEFVDAHGVVPLMADFTDGSAEIQEWLDRFGAIGIPLTVIFPADNPDEPIILDGVYWESTLLEHLEDAVAEQSQADVAANPENGKPRQLSRLAAASLPRE